MPKLFSIKPTLTLWGRKFNGIRGWAGKPTHPPLTGFWDWWKGLPRDSSTGFIGKAEHTQVWRTANWHMAVMLTVTAIVLTDIVLRFAQFDDGATGAAVMVLSILAAGLVALGAAYGGALVFEYQFNVQPLKGSTAWNETEDDQLPGSKLPPS